jgi:hypothetical protein
LIIDATGATTTYGAFIQNGIYINSLGTFEYFIPRLSPFVLCMFSRNNLNHSDNNTRLAAQFLNNMLPTINVLYPALFEQYHANWEALVRLLRGTKLVTLKEHYGFFKTHSDSISEYIYYNNNQCFDATFRTPSPLMSNTGIHHFDPSQVVYNYLIQKIVDSIYDQ